jgi:hypothetical protein
VKLIEHVKHFLFGHPAPPAQMAEYMAAAARVSAAARKAGVANLDTSGPFGAMAQEMRIGPKAASRKRSKRMK